MANGRGGARSGAGRPKGSKNKLSRTQKATISELASKHTEAALETLVEIMESDLAPAAARVSAANSVLDRAYGKPVQANVEANPEDFKEVFDGWHIERAELDQGNAD